MKKRILFLVLWFALLGIGSVWAEVIEVQIQNPTSYPLRLANLYKP